MTDFTNRQILEYMTQKYGKICPLGEHILDYFRKMDLMRLSARDGRICAVVLFRKVKLAKYDDKDRLSHDERGDCAFVSELCAQSKKDIAILEHQMRQRLGKTHSIGMHRRGKARFYDYEKYISKLLGKD